MKNNTDNKIVQISTIQALLLGYLNNVITVKKLKKYGDIGLGTFENVNGEMIILDNVVYKANNKGQIIEADLSEGVPFAAICQTNHCIEFNIENIDSMNSLKTALTNAIEEDFGLNSIYVVRLDGHYDLVKARSEKGKKAQHTELSLILKDNQEDFIFENVDGTMVCVYYPDYMDGINAAGWHLHFISKDRTVGGHVFDLSFKEIQAKRYRSNTIEIKIPTEPAFDTYSLKQISNNDVKEVEQ